MFCDWCAQTKEGSTVHAYGEQYCLNCWNTKIDLESCFSPILEDVKWPFTNHSCYNWSLQVAYAVAKLNRQDTFFVNGMEYDATGDTWPKNSIETQAKVDMILGECRCGGPAGHVKHGIHCRL